MNPAPNSTMFKRLDRNGAVVVNQSLEVKPPAGPPHRRQWLRTHATAILKETVSEGSGYFSIVEGHDRKLYIGTAKYGSNAYLVEFDPRSGRQKIVVDAMREIGSRATGFAAQAKFHTRNQVGESGRIYVGTKQGYPMPGESRDSYPGGYPMVYDPKTGRTRVYPIPVPRHGIISVVPDERRGIAYVSTCDDARPIESTHFMVLDLETGVATDLLDCRHSYAFIVVDHRGRAYHPVLGGKIARYDPETRRLEQLEQRIDGAPPTAQSLLAQPEPHPLNWDLSPDRKTLWCAAMGANELISYDLTTSGNIVDGRSFGKLIADAVSTDCRALCVGPDGTVWMGLNADFGGKGQFLHLARFRPGRDKAVQDLGPLAIANPDYTSFQDRDGKDLPWHHGVVRQPDGTLIPRYVVMGICAARSGRVFVTTLYPFTVHEIRVR
jgi:sugar lactone lactonase YvrE